MTTAHPCLYDHTGPDGRLHPNLGRLIQPRHTSSIEATTTAHVPWAADNDCFNRFDSDAWVRMLERIRPLAGSTYNRATGSIDAHYKSSSCLFVTVPDVVGNAYATARKFELWESAIRRRGLPSALVLQDGAEADQRWIGQLAWSRRIRAVFIGGTTTWKLGPDAVMLARFARSRGLWVHWGRVNTERRIDHVIATGACDSIDGTQWARWRHTHLDRGLAYVHSRAIYEASQLRLAV